jgi:hypothetical protein
MPALRGIALGRKSLLFAGSDRGRERAAIMLSPIYTCKLNDILALALELGRPTASPPDHGGLSFGP